VSTPGAVTAGAVKMKSRHAEVMNAFIDKDEYDFG